MKPKILCVGEILWDLLPSGKQLGGAPANFAYHAHALGAEARVVSRVGDDSLGSEILGRLDSLGLATDGVGVDATAPTGTVSVELEDDGQPRYVIHENVAWDRLDPDARSLTFAESAEAVCFGSLAQRCETSRAAILRLVSRTPRTALRVFDVNLRQQYYSRDIVEASLAAANALKLNDAELPVLAEMLKLTGGVREQIAALAARFELRAVALTRGAHGSLLFADGLWSDRPGLPTQVVDTIGAGDAFTAAWTVGLLDRQPLDDVNRRANELARFVCSRPGATPAYPAQEDSPR